MWLAILAAKFGILGRERERDFISFLISQCGVPNRSAVCWRNHVIGCGTSSSTHDSFCTVCWGCVLQSPLQFAELEMRKALSYPGSSFPFSFVLNGTFIPNFS